jgi:hypothetical protein
MFTFLKADKELTFRTATVDGLHNLATIACAAFPANLQWNYRFPRQKEYPENTFKCTKEGYRSTPKKDGVTVKVITTAVEGEQRASDHKTHPSDCSEQPTG